MRTWIWCVAAVMALLGGSESVDAAASEPPISTTPLPFTSFGDIAVAPTGYAFVSGGPGSSSIQVLDLDGTIVDTIDGVQGAMGLVAVGGSLYAALRDADAIVTISTDTLTETARVSLPDGTAPSHLAVSDDRFWFCSGAELASVTTAGTMFTTYSGIDFPWGCELVATTRTNPRRLIAVSGDSPTTVYVYDLSTIPPTLLKKGSPEGGNPQDIAITGDDTALMLASGAPYFLQKLALPGLGVTATYATGPYPTAVALPLSGDSVAGGVLASSPPVYVFPVNSSSPSRSYTFLGGLYAGGLAFSPNGRKLFAVSGADSSSTAVRLLDNRLPNSLTLRRSASRVSYGRSVRVTAHLGLWDDDRTVSIYATPSGGEKRLVARGVADATGDFDATYVMRKKTRFVAEYAGDETYEDVTSSVATVDVRVIVRTAVFGSYGRSGRFKLYHLGDVVKQRGTVIPNHAGRRLGFLIQRYSGAAWRPFASASFRIRANGTVTGYIAPGVGRYRTRNGFAGDADHLGGTSAWRYLRVTS